MSTANASGSPSQRRAASATLSQDENLKHPDELGCQTIQVRMFDASRAFFASTNRMPLSSFHQSFQYN